MDNYIYMYIFVYVYNLGYSTLKTSMSSEFYGIE